MSKPTYLDMKNEEKMHEKIKNLSNYLDVNVFFGLKNLNDGFDYPSNQYFSNSDFYVIMQRCENLGIGIWGMESWLKQQKKINDIRYYESFKTFAFNPRWYFEAYQQLAASNNELMFLATYYLPSHDI